MATTLRPPLLLALALLLTGCDDARTSSRAKESRAKGSSEKPRPEWTAPKTSLGSDVAVWAKWLAERTDLPEAKDWKRARVGVLLPSVFEGELVASEEDVLVAPDGGRAYTFDGVRVRVAPDGLRRGHVGLRVPHAEGPGGAAVLLALGRVKEAEALPQIEGTHAPRPTVQGALVAHAWHRHDEAIAALMRGDDIEGLRIAEALLADLPALRATIETLKERDGTIGAPEDRLKFLDDIPALAADLKRRTTSPAVATKPPDPNDPDALVRALDEARERQLGQPGVVVIADDPNVRRLATRGDAAVPALLKALEGDDRLTRSVGFGRDFWPERVIYTVRSAAYAALLKIAGQDEIPGARRSDGTLDVPAVRAYMAANRGLSPAQRLLRAMETPVAPDDIGNDASATVRRLLDPPGSERGKFTYQGVPFDRLDSGRAKTADALAPAEHARLVAALDARTRESLATPEGQGYDAFRVGTACDLAVGRALIEPRGALPLLREVWAGVGRTNPGWFDQNPQMVADLVAVRVSLGDEGFRKEGVAWLGAHLRELAGFSFEAPPARLAPLLRRAAVEALTDRTVVGTLTLLSNGSIGLASKVGSSQAESEVKEVGYQLDVARYPARGPTEIAPGKPYPLRRADLAGLAIAERRSWARTPAFSLGWTQAHRDAALAEFAKDPLKLPPGFPRR